MTSRETETDARTASKWRRLKASLFGRKAPPTAEELTPSSEPEAAPMPEPEKAEPSAALSSSLSPDAPPPLATGDREKKRRSGSAKRQRERGFMVRVTDDEFTAIRDRARNAGLSVAAYLRACALGDKGPRARRSPPLHGDLLAQAIAALNRVGNNVNQIAHKLNAGGHPAHAEIAAAHAEISACLKLIADALGRGS